MKRTILALLLITTLFASFACERRNGSGTNATDGGGEIVVGYYGDLTGRTASFGTSTRNGVEMAAEEINKAGGVMGRKVRVIVEDDQGEPNKAATVVSKLVNQDKVHAVLGEVASSNSLAAAPKAQEAKVPMISPSSTNPNVTQVGDYIFRVCFIDPFQGDVMAKFAAKNLNAKRAAILYDFNADYSRGLREFFTRSFKASGGEIVAEQSYTQGDRDFSGQLTAIRSANPDVIYVPGYYGEVGVISNQSRQLGIKAPLLGGDGWDSPQLWELGGASLNGNYISNHYSVDDPSPAIQKFVGDYRAKFNILPDALAALGYDSMKVLADAITRAGGTDGAKLRDAIAQTKNFAGVTGSISIDKDRNAVKPAVVLKLVWDPAAKAGKFNYDTTIYPEGMTPPATSAASPAAGAASPASAASPGTSPPSVAPPTKAASPSSGTNR